MQLSCPLCKQSFALRNIKPGSYTPKCPKCAQAFALVVLQAPPEPVENIQVTGTYLPPTEPMAVGALAPAEDGNATGAYQPGPGTEAFIPSAATEVTAPPTRLAPANDHKAADLDMPRRLGGYDVIKELGRGGMGAVYLGRQVSLDRRVALKVMNPRWSSDPGFVARFTREAYAAAQLVHHNVVQIYDIGQERDINFFSMEFVPGQSLAALTNKEGKLDIELAVNYVLQAARGLKFGHDLGMVHRDVKPDNLMVNDQGIVKVADLGLVKVGDTPEVKSEAAANEEGAAHLTKVGSAMGTPAYMAPEQARDSSRVDGRADIYSLGCSLYVMVTGRPPFEGKTVLEVLTKHATAPVVPPEVIVKRVPKALSAILLKMMAKKPGDRYANMDEVILALEEYLGIRTSGPFTPREEHASKLEDCVQRFNDSSWARIRQKLIPAFFGGTAFLFLGSLLLGRLLLAGGFLGLMVLTPLAYFVVRGLGDRTYLFLKGRELVFGSRIVDWLTWLTGGAIGVLVLYLLNLHWVWLGFCVAAAALAAGMYFVVDKQVAQQRAECLDEAEQLFRGMRLQGLEEETLRQFVCKYAGNVWEEFFEALFGYEAMRVARDWLRGEGGKERRKQGVLRDQAVLWINTTIRARKEARERRLLRAVEEKALRAAGVEGAEARRKASQMADVLVEQAAEVQRTPRGQTANLRRIVEAARKPEAAYDHKEFRPRTPLWLRLGQTLLGGKARFLTGAALVAGCLLWMQQNDLIPTKQRLQATAEQALQAARDTKVPTAQELGEQGKALLKGDARQTAADLSRRATQQAQSLGQLARQTRPLDLPGVPSFVSGWFDDFNAGVAGMLLLLSVVLGGPRFGLLIWPIAFLTFVGQRFGVPALGPVTAAHVSMALGIVLAVGGLVVLRRQ